MVLVQERRRKTNPQNCFHWENFFGSGERENNLEILQGEMKTIDALSSDFTQKISALEATHKAIKLSPKRAGWCKSAFDRRINELTGMHRLNEERFRQEWLSLKVMTKNVGRTITYSRRTATRWFPAFGKNYRPHYNSWGWSPSS